MSQAFFDSADASVYQLLTAGAGPSGALPVTDALLRERPSGDLFGWTLDAGMGWAPQELGRKEFLMK